MNLKVKKNDTIVVISGRDKGKQGKVTQVFPQEGMVVAEGINLRVKHLKAKSGSQAGNKVQYAAPLLSSKVMVVCPQCSKPTRVKMVTAADGKLVRSCHRCKQPLASAA
jgi:large subunit ribosomal protein L24